VALMRTPEGNEIIATGQVRGHISLEPVGDDWGYNPIFVPDDGDGRTFAQMTSAEKYAISHRGRAFRNLRDALPDVL
jgi:XTP/dITP diphosphohydrolase